MLCRGRLGPGIGEAMNMNTKKKLFTIGLGVVIILIVFTLNVIRRMKLDSDIGLEEVVNKENVITRAEAYRYLSYLEYDKKARDLIPMGITYADQKMSDWYDAYVNAVWKMGLIEANIEVNPKEALTYGHCKELMDKLIVKYPQFQAIYNEVDVKFTKAKDYMLIPEFLALYENILSKIPETDRLVKKETLLVLGKETDEDGLGRMIADKGKYFYKNAGIYDIYYDQKGEIIRQEEEIPANVDMAVSDAVAKYLDQGIVSMVCGSEILYISQVTTERIVINNVWIKKGDGIEVETFVNGIHKQFEAKAPLSNTIDKVIGDIAIENRKVVQITMKPDIIQGKVLLTGKGFIEIEGYGKVNLDENYKIYKIYGELSMEPSSSILVGYDNTDFVVSGGKISAVLIKESIKAENIRVLLKTTGFGSIHHDKVELTCSSDYIISDNESEIIHKAGETVVIEPGSELLANGRIKITPVSDLGKIQLLSITRSSANPKYRGSIEVAESNGGLIVVNELPLEEYLYAVIPSEMPTYYGVEALKVQAVCARSYAYRHLMANSLREYGAHVDDSVSYQVYNNIPENEDSILAVKDTYGKVIQYNGNVITAYYFSTSCGHTTNVEHVWANGEATPYLKGKLIAANSASDNDFTKEENFRNFILNNTSEGYESEFNWYRWTVTIDVDDIKENIDSILSSRYEANSSLVLTLVSGEGDDEDAVFESIPVTSLGAIKDIKVLKRGVGGIISELLIVGSNNTVKVLTEYNIRLILSPVKDILIRHDQSQVNNLKLLPSAFCIIDRNEENGVLKSLTITGGGYGHGVGMSQNGVKALVDAGKEYDEIVEYFYEGTNVGFIY